MQADLRLIAIEVHGYLWWILQSNSARFALGRRTRTNANTQYLIYLNDRAARSFRYTVLYFRSDRIRVLRLYTPF